MKRLKSPAGSRLSETPVPPRASFEILEGRTLLSATHWHGKSGSLATSASAATAVVAQTAPVLAAVPNATVNYGSTFTYQLSATGTPAPTFSLNDAPDGVVVDSASGLISWRPTLGDVGTDTISVTAANAAGSSSTSFNVTVTNYVAPVITTPPSQNAVKGTTFTYQIAATGTPAPAFALLAAPDGMTISASGLISWAAPNANVGAQNVTVQATNPGGTTTSTFAITVGPDVTPPTTPVLSLGTITTVDSIPLSWTPAADNIGVAGYRIYNYTPAVYRGHSGRGGGYRLVSPAKRTLLVDNITSTSYTVTGLAPNSTHQYLVTAFDAAGNESGSSGVVIGTTLNPPSFHWTYYGATDPAMTDVADHALTFYFNTTGSPAPDLSLVSAPAGVVFTPGQITNSQLTFVIPSISWTPTADEVGVNYITMKATNSVGTYTMSIQVTVTPDTPQVSVSLNGGITYGASQFASGPSNYVVNAIAAFGSATSPQYGVAGTPFNFQVSSASNAGPTTFSLVSGPAGMTLDPNTGAGAWTPAKDTAGNTTVVVAATNSAGTSMLKLSFPTYFTGAPARRPRAIT